MSESSSIAPGDLFALYLAGLGPGSNRNIVSPEDPSSVHYLYAGPPARTSPPRFPYAQPDPGDSSGNDSSASFAYDPAGAMGGLFAPALVRGNAASEAAFADWMARNLKAAPAPNNSAVVPTAAAAQPAAQPAQPFYGGGGPYSGGGPAAPGLMPPQVMLGVS